MERTEHAKSEPPTGRAGIAALSFAFALQHGMEIEEVERLTGVNGYELMDPEARVADDILPNLWGALSKLHPGKAISLEMSRSTPLSITGDLAHSAQFANSLAGALQLIAENSVLLADRLTVAFEESGSESVFSTRHPLDSVARGLLNEMGLGVVWRMIRDFTTVELRPLRVEFAHRVDGPLDPYQEYFGCEVQLAATRNALVFEPSSLATPTNQASVALFAFAQEHLRQSRRRLRDLTVPPSLRLLLQSMTSNAAQGRFDTQSVATGAGMSLRSAQRIASEHGTALAELIRKNRLDLARDALSNPTLSVQSVARLVGYSDDRSFRRAFQSWTGQTPAQFRRGGS